MPTSPIIVAEAVTSPPSVLPVDEKPRKDALFPALSVSESFARGSASLGMNSVMSRRAITPITVRMSAITLDTPMPPFEETVWIIAIKSVPPNASRKL